MKYFFAILLLSSFLGAEIPFNEALGVLSATKNQKIKIPNQKEEINLKDISPFFGMVALHSGLIEEIRFNGNYIKKLDNGKEIDEGQDVIAKLIKRLFNSPDGVSLTATTYDNDPVGNLSRNLPFINAIIDTLISIDRDKAKVITDLLNILDNNISKENKEFANILVSAFNKENNFSKLYPKHIVIISLLAFYAKVADSKEDFRHLHFLIDYDDLNKSNFTKEDYLKYKAIIDKEKENDYMPKNELPKLGNNQDSNIELAFLMFKGKDYYDTIFSPPGSYRSDTVYKGKKFSDCGETSLKNLLALLFSAYKAGQISLKSLEDNLKSYNKRINLENYEPFINMKAFFIKFNNMALLSSKNAHDTWVKVVSNLNTYNNSELNKIIYNSKKQQCELKADMHKDIRGIFNMFNLIAHIIPDEVLTKPWSEDLTERYKELADKLDRLVLLFSNENIKYSWHVENSNDKNINTPFPTIIFNINNDEKNKIAWIFESYHFDVKLINNLSFNDWRLNYDNNSIVFPNEYLAFLYKRTSLSEHHVTTLYNKYIDEFKLMSFILEHNNKFYLPLLGIRINKLSLDNDNILSRLAVLMLPYHDILKTMSKILGDEKVEKVINKKLKLKKVISVINNYHFWPSLPFIIEYSSKELISFSEKNKLIHLLAKNDVSETLEKLLDIYRGNLSHDKYVELFSKIDDKSPLDIAVAYDNKETVKLLLKELPPELLQNDINNLIKLAISKNSIKTLALFFKDKGHINNVIDDYGRTPLMVAVIINESYKTTKALLELGADVSIKNNSGETVLDMAKRYQNQKLIALLESYIN